MEAGTLVLLHSPLVGVESWGALPEALTRGGVEAVAVPVGGDDRPPFAGRYVEGAVAGTLRAAPRRGSLGLVGHSGAGPLLGAVGAGLAARGRPAGGYLFCDAGLPRDGATRLEWLAAEDAGMAAAFRAELERGGRFPAWGDAELAPLVPDPAVRGALGGALGARGVPGVGRPRAGAAGPRPGRPRRPGRVAAAEGPGLLHRAAAAGARLGGRALRVPAAGGG